MGKIKKTPVEEDEHPNEILRQKLKRSNKIITKDGKIKKKIPKQFTAFQCDVCNKKFTDKSNLSLHQKLHLNEAYSCDLCPYVGATKKYLARHKLSRHSAPRHACGVCGRAFHHPCGLREHSMVHTGEKPLECAVCGKSFRVSYSLNCHMRIHKNEKPFQCSFCEYACRDSSTLRKHEHRHMGIVRTFTCKICRKKFDSKPKLKCHISEIHLEYLEVDVKKYSCDQCGKAFKKKCHLNTHVQVVHSAAPCVCPLCGRRVKHERYLPAHLRTHFPERPHVCAHPGCGKAFKDKSVLNKHSKIHQPHLHAACARCGATFARPHRLAAHMRTHEPREKSVTCHYCHVSFYTKNYLIKHIKQKHTGDKAQYICEHCGLITYNKPSIVMHLKYGQCRKNMLFCTICKTKYKKLEYLRSHYLKTHKMLYRPMKRKKKPEMKPSVEVKVEPVDEPDPYEEVQLSLLDVSKEEVEVEEEGVLENDLLQYSSRVLAEELQTYLLREPGRAEPDSGFDHFLLKHVFPHVKEEDPEPKIEKTDAVQEAIVTQKIKDIMQKAKEDEAKKILEKKQKRKEKLLETKLRREAKIMRRKKRRERFELERLRQMYNERMKKAAEEALKKEPAKKIKYFQQKPSEDLAEKEPEKANDSNDKHDHINKLNKYQNSNKVVDTNENDIRKDTIENNNLASYKNTDNDVNLTDNIINLSNYNDDIPENSTTHENDNSVAKIVGIEPSSDVNSVNDRNINASDTNRSADSTSEITSDDQSSINDIEEVTNDQNTKTDKNKAINNKPSFAADEVNVTSVTQSTNDMEVKNDSQNCVNDKVEACKDQSRANDEGKIISHDRNSKNYKGEGANDIQNCSLNDKSNIYEFNYTNDKNNSYNNGDSAKGLSYDDDETDADDADDRPNDEGDNRKEFNKDDDETDADDANDNLSDKGDNRKEFNRDEDERVVDVTNDKDNKNRKVFNKDEDDTDADDANDNLSDKGDNRKEFNKDDDETDADDANEKDENGKELNDKEDDDETDVDDADDSDYEPSSEGVPRKKMKFQTYQCYICFKLYSTKEELMSHCQSHFDICSNTTLSKCPACGHVKSKNMAKHMRVKHGMHVNIPYNNLTTRDDGQGSKYCYKMADTVMEIIPSVKMLNHSASIQIDRRKREMRDKMLAKTRLVKKGTEWIVEKYAADVSYEEMPAFTEQELSRLPLSSGYVERLGQLGKLARRQGLRILFPCQTCDKICQNLSALKLHGRRHDPDKKPFAPRRSRRDQPTAVEDAPQKNNIANRTAKPQPIKNKHKCDEKLKEFYESHIRGADIEFWQFLKIYNKMDRQNVNEFADLESRTDFGLHNHGDSSASTSKTLQNEETENATSKTSQEINKRKREEFVLDKNNVTLKKSSKSMENESEIVDTSKLVQQSDSKMGKTPSNLVHQSDGTIGKTPSKLVHQSDSKIGKTPSKLGQQSLTAKKSFKRVIMISKSQHLERENIKKMLREKNKDLNKT